MNMFNRTQSIILLIVSSFVSSTIFIYYLEESNIIEHWDFYIINAGTNFIVYELWNEVKVRMGKKK